MNKKRIAILFQDNYFDQKGSFNATRNRIRFLHSIADFDIDVFLIQTYEPWYVRLLRKTKKQTKLKRIYLDNIEYRIIVRNFSLFDFILTQRFHLAGFFSYFFKKKIAKLFYSYDLLSAHSTFAGSIALEVYKKRRVPFVITWHGSDIHTSPFLSKELFIQTRLLLENSKYNFFVSNALLQCAKTISDNFKGEVLYNGVDERFCRYDIAMRQSLKKKYGVEGSRVVAFVGGLVAIKNVHLLPQIFTAIYAKSENKNLTFWIIGDGKLKSSILADIKKCNNLNCLFWGNVDSVIMPELYNCVDLLVLPSKNEGLPLVTVEALACGASVVGSNVGGIPEVIGKENSFDLDKAFIEKLSTRAVELLNSQSTNSLKPDFDWEKTAKQEEKAINRIIYKYE